MTSEWSFLYFFTGVTSVVFPGSFDPPTYGHLDIIDRARKLFDTVHVVISTNPHKNYCFSSSERHEILERHVKIFPGVRVVNWDGLIVEYAQQQGIKIILRGLRPLSDFAYEFELAMLNHQLSAELETLFIPTSPRYSVLRSSSLKEMASFGVPLESMAPPDVLELLRKKVSNLGKTGLK